jgi:DcuC family C4-dicarboxylate transporter
VGFFTNMAITSQTAAAAAVGPILVPLMTGAGYHPIIAAATLVLGCSAGGNLFNPGEPDVVNVQINANVAVHDVINTIVLPELAGFVIAIAVFMVLAKRVREERSLMDSGKESAQGVNIIKALLPPLPVAMLFILMPSFKLVPQVSAWYPDGLPVVHAMLVSTMIAMIVVRKELSLLTKQFFEGLGYGYVHVISLIITATCFIDALKMCGVIDTLVSSIASSGVFGYISATASTLVLAVVSGSGTAPSVAFSKAVLPELLGHGTDLQSVLDIGALGAIGATFGRTMSPVAAIVIFASTLTNTKPQDIVKHTSIPLLIGATAAVVVIWVL